jgi:hypothetical protein
MTFQQETYITVEIWTIVDDRGSIPSRTTKCSLLHSVQTDFRAQPAYLMAVSPGVKQQEREADHSTQSSAEVKNGGAIPPLPHISS